MSLKQIIQNRLKYYAAGTFLLLSSQAMGHNPFSEKDPQKSKNKIELANGKTVVSGDALIGVEAEGMVGNHAVQSFNGVVFPELEARAGNFRIGANAHTFLTNDTPNREFDYCCSQMMIEAGLQLGKGELVFYGGKIKNLNDNASSTWGSASVATDNYVIDIGLVGITNNTVKVGYRTEKGLIEIGWIGSNQEGTSIFDFSKFKGGSAIAVVGGKLSDELSLKAMAISDFKELKNFTANAVLDLKKRTICAECGLIQDDPEHHRLIGAVTLKEKELCRSLAAYVKGICQIASTDEVELMAIAGVEHTKSGVFANVGFNKQMKGKKINPTASIGWRKYWNAAKIK